MLLLLENLNPSERAAYVLREAFNYSHQQIAGILDTTEANARQLYTRARKHVTSGRRAPASAEEHRKLVDAFLNAASTGDISVLEALLAPSAVSIADGGGKVTAARVPIEGRERLARIIAGFRERYWKTATFAIESFNNVPAMVIRIDGRIFAITTIESGPEGIDKILWFMNPEKLSHLETTSGPRE